MKVIQKIPLKLSVFATSITVLAMSAWTNTSEAGQQPGTAGKPADKKMTEKSSGAQKRVELKEVSGKIAKIKQVEVRGADTKNTVVMLKTNKNNRRLVVDLGPTTALEAHQLEVGKEIQVEGRPVQVREHRFLVANRFKTNGKVINIQRKQQLDQHKSGKQQAGKSGQDSSSS